MTDNLKRIVAFCAGRYNSLRDTPRHNLAKAHLIIMNQVREFGYPALILNAIRWTG